MKDLHGEDYIDSEDVIENIDELENDIQTLREELDELTQELDTLEGEINALSSARDRQCQELDILVSERKEREDKGMSAEDITEKIEDINTHLTGLEDELKARAKDVEKVKGQIDDREKTLSDTEEELRPYKDLAEQCENYGEWKYGVRLIRKGEFKNYAQDLAEDIGAIDENAKWPVNCIDWDQAADELEQDYSSFDFDGEEYLMCD